MTTESPSPNRISKNTADAIFLEEWRAIVLNSCEILRQLAGTTEDEFLQIGSKLQDFYLRASDITAMANQLVESVSGDQVQPLIDRLRQMMGDLEAYLASAGSRSSDSCGTLEQIIEQLGQVSHPLQSYQKMTKVLRMLGISTKIESSRLGDVGLGFLTLAMDVEKLSHLVSDKSSNILGHRQILLAMIQDNLKLARASQASQGREVGGILVSTSQSLDELIAVNSRCGTLGNMISSVSGEVSDNISEVVSSMQMHDMTRQQVEHIVEALERLSIKLQNSDTGSALIVEAGDVCELQEAQLRFASSELCGAVGSIMENLKDVASKQSRMAEETFLISGSDASGGSFVDSMSQGMAAITTVLSKCARSDHEMSVTLSKVAETMQEVTGFVTDIEDIGLEIDLIALNSQIKAAHTGREGAALGVLAEAIKRLSVDAVTQTETVSAILMQINQCTDHLFQGATEETRQLNDRIEVMKEELSGILSALGTMNTGLTALLSNLNSRVGMLTEDIEQTTAGIDVHERVAAMSGEVMANLERIVKKARELQPASTEFKDNLRHMEERYTMQSERHIHESIARKRGGGATAPLMIATPQSVNTNDSEFGDNVDLF